MNELNMSIYTGKDDANKVTLTASFETHEEAVAFHTGLAALCRSHSPTTKANVYANRLLGWSAKTY